MLSRRISLFSAALLALAAPLFVAAPSLAGRTAEQNDLISHSRPYVAAYEDTLLDLARENGLVYLE